MNEDMAEKLASGKWIALPAWVGILKFINPILILAGIFYLGQKEQNYENRLFKDSNERARVIQHTEDMNVHMSLRNKIDFFVPRTEIEYKLQKMDEKLDHLLGNGDYKSEK